MADLTLRLAKGSPLTNAEVDANFSSLNEAITIGGEPMGHEDRAQSTLSFNASTRTVTVAPVSGSFTVWVKGNKFVFTTAQTVVIPNTTGLHYVYFNTSGVLSSHMTYFDWPNEAPTAYVAWNATTGAAPFFGDERHGITLDWQTHEYLHRTRGAALANGFSISNYTIAGTGASDADAQLDLSGGTFFDEDLQVDVVSTNSPTANTWEQDLSGPAQIPVLYRSGTGWVRDNPTNFVLKAGTATPRYNTESGGVWGLTDVPNNSYSAVWVIATNNLTYPVVAIMGQDADNNAAQAENFDWSELNLDGFPAIEFRPLYKIVFQCSSGYTNTIKARFTNVFDIRNLVSASPAATIGSSHGGLSGLGADDHLQYIHITEVRSPSAAVKNSFLPAQTGQTGKFLTTDGTNPSWATMTAPNNGTLTLAVSGTGLSGSASFTANQAGNSTFTVTSNATSANTTGAIVARDGSGNFSANVITAVSFTGSASGLTGLKTVNGNSILGSGNIQIDGGVTSFNTRTGAITLSSDDVTTALGFTPYNATNPSGYTTNVGTVTGVTAGTGLTGGTITSSGTIDLATSGVTAGTYTKLTVDAYGRATVGASLSSSDVTTALGFTPYDATNPSSYITTAGARSALSFVAGSGAYNSTTGAITIPTNTTHLTNGSGYITASASITGNAATATALQTARTINGTSFNGTANITVTASTTNTLTLGSYLTGISFNGSAAVTAAVDATTTNTASKVVARDASGNFSAGTISAALSGNATTATTLQTARTINGTSFNGSANITTANWGTARTLTIGSTGKSVDGSANVAWSLTEIGAAAAAHDHDRNFITDSRGAARAPSYYDDRFAQWDFQNTSDTGAGGDLWHGLLTVAKWDVYDASHRQEQLAFTGDDLKRRTATSDTAWGAWKVLLDSNNYNSYAPTLTGTGASGTWGISITGSSASTTGNAATATTLQTARTINGTSFNGSANITVTANTTNTLTRGTYLTGSDFNGSAATTWAVDATTTATASKVVARDASGYVFAVYYNSTGTFPVTASAGASGMATFTGTNGTDNYGRGYTAAAAAALLSGQTMNIAGSSTSCTGNAATATALQTARTINGVSFNGTANITVADATKLPLAGGTMTGAITFAAGQTWPTFNQSTTGNAATATTATTANALATGNNYQVNSIGVGAAASGVAGRVNGTTGVFTPNTSGVSTGVTVVNGDLTAYRSGGTTGVVYLSSSGSHYLYWDGTNYNLNSGNLVCTGNITAYSDERLKKDWAPVATDFIERLAGVKSGTYTRTDTGERQAGASAQDWQKLLPEVVNTCTDDEKTLSLAYGNAALVSAVELAKEVVELRAKLVKLEALVGKLIEG